MQSSQWRIQDFPDNLLFGLMFPENRMKMKNIWREGVTRALDPSMDVVALQWRIGFSQTGGPQTRGLGQKPISWQVFCPTNARKWKKLYWGRSRIPSALLWSANPLLSVLCVIGFEFAFDWCE